MNTNSKLAGGLDLLGAASGGDRRHVSVDEHVVSENKGLALVLRSENGIRCRSDQRGPVVDVDTTTAPHFRHGAGALLDDARHDGVAAKRIDDVANCSHDTTQYINRVNHVNMINVSKSAMLQT
jgi:hypothetical protein